MPNCNLVAKFKLKKGVNMCVFKNRNLDALIG